MHWGSSNKQNRPKSQGSQCFPLNGRRKTLNNHISKTVRQMVLWRKIKLGREMGVMMNVCGVLNRAIEEKMTFLQKSEGGEGVSQADISEGAF